MAENGAAAEHGPQDGRRAPGRPAVDGSGPLPYAGDFTMALLALGLAVRPGQLLLRRTSQADETLPVVEKALKAA
ncbi:hypothetical protein [Streptomyces sp. LN245]|uniref:hypothetical protein n=1 Tax=Streptomyces sp. LN245 TaxID=3112975 RepID=UPI00370FD4FF